jgi:hypothetical protein
LAIDAVEGGLRIEVADGSATLPMRGLGGADAMTGRGLLMVDALAADSGAIRTSTGKVVWALLRPGTVAQAVADVSADELLSRWAEPGLDGDGVDPRFDVDLGDVPTDLLVAAKTHVDNVVREFALMTAGSNDGGVGAATLVPAHLARVLQAVTTRFADARGAIKKRALAAAARGETRTRLRVRLTSDAADAGMEYLRCLDQIDRYCRGARLLTLESPATHKAFRRWYVTEIVRQLRGSGEGKDVATLSFESFLLAEVERLTAAEAAADRASRLARVAAAVVRADVQDDVAAAIVQEAVAGMNASAGALITSRSRRLQVAAAVGYAPPLVAALNAEPIDAELPAATVMRTGRAVWLESSAELTDRFPQLEVFEHGTVSLCVVPLLLHGRTIGALRLSFDTPHVFDSDERGFITAVAGQAALALRAARKRGS